MCCFFNLLISSSVASKHRTPRAENVSQIVSLLKLKYFILSNNIGKKSTSDKFNIVLVDKERTTCEAFVRINIAFSGMRLTFHVSHQYLYIDSFLLIVVPYTKPTNDLPHILPIFMKYNTHVDFFDTIEFR